MSRRRQNSSPFSLFSFQDIITATTGILILLALILALSVVMQTADPVTNEPAENTSALIVREQKLREDVEKLSKTANQISSNLDMVIGFTPQELRNKKGSLDATVKILADNLDREKQHNKQQENRLRTQKERSDFLEDARELADLKQKVSDAAVEIENLKKDNRVFYNFRQASTSPWMVEIGGATIKVARAGVTQAARKYTTAREVVDFAKAQPVDQRYFVLLVKPSGIEKFALLREYLAKETADIGVELLAENEIAIDSEKGAATQ